MVLKNWNLICKSVRNLLIRKFFNFEKIFLIKSRSCFKRQTLFKIFDLMSDYFRILSRILSVDNSRSYLLFKTNFFLFHFKREKRFIFKELFLIFMEKSEIILILWFNKLVHFINYRLNSTLNISQNRMNCLLKLMKINEEYPFFEEIQVHVRMQIILFR